MVDIKTPLNTIKGTMISVGFSPVHRHIYADELARGVGYWTEAEAQVVKGYREDPSLANGFARIGSILRAEGKYAEALRWYRRDRQKRRLRHIHRTYYAELLAGEGHLTDACNEMQHAYDKDSTLIDGFARIAIIAGNQINGEAKLEYLAKDAKLGVLTQNYHHAYLKFSVRFGNFYQTLESLAYLADNLKFDDLPPESHLEYAELLVKAGNLKKAAEEVERIDSSCTILNDHIAIFKRIVHSGT